MGVPLQNTWPWFSPEHAPSQKGQGKLADSCLHLDHRDPGGSAYGEINLRLFPDPHTISSWSSEDHSTPSPLSIPVGKGANLPSGSSHLGPQKRSEGLGRPVPKETPPPTTTTKKQNNPPREAWVALGCFFSHLSLPPPPRSLTRQGRGSEEGRTRASCFSQGLFWPNS